MINKNKNIQVVINKSDLQELRDTLLLCSLLDKSGRAFDLVDKLDRLYPFLTQ